VTVTFGPRQFGASFGISTDARAPGPLLPAASDSSQSAALSKACRHSATRQSASAVSFA